MSRVMRKPAYAYAKTKPQISSAVISASVFATYIVQSIYLLNLEFQASNHLLWLYRPDCVRPGRKSRRQVFSRRGSYHVIVTAILVSESCNLISERAYLRFQPETIPFDDCFVVFQGIMAIDYRKSEIKQITSYLPSK